MLNLPKEQRIHNLLNEAVTHASAIDGSFSADIVSALHKATTVLSAPVKARAHLVLILSAARRHILDLEKRTVRLIIGREPINQQEMASLVRIRLICTELLKILADAQAGLRLSRGQETKRLSGSVGS